MQTKLTIVKHAEYAHFVNSVQTLVGEADVIETSINGGPDVDYHVNGILVAQAEYDDEGNTYKINKNIGFLMHHKHDASYSLYVWEPEKGISPNWQLWAGGYSSLAEIEQKAVADTVQIIHTQVALKLADRLAGK